MSITRWRTLEIIADAPGLKWTQSLFNQILCFITILDSSVIAFFVKVYTINTIVQIEVENPKTVPTCSTSLIIIYQSVQSYCRGFSMTKISFSFVFLQSVASDYRYTTVCLSSWAKQNNFKGFTPRFFPSLSPSLVFLPPFKAACLFPPLWHSSGCVKTLIEVTCVD